MDKELEEKYRDPIRDKCFKEREELRTRVAELENDKLMLEGRLDMSRSLVAGARVEIVQLEKQLSLLQHKKHMMHEEIDIADDAREQAERRCAGLEEALWDYGGHNAGCLWTYSRCTCGFEEVRATLSSEAREDADE